MHRAPLRSAFFCSHKIGSPSGDCNSLDYREGDGDRKSKEKTTTTSSDERWNAMCKALREYKEFHGHTLVLQSYTIDDDGETKEQLRLGRWVNHLRQKGKMTLMKTDPKKVEELNKLGFVWQQRLTLNEWVQHLKDFLKQNLVLSCTKVI